jgi:hypothetical protein
MRSNGQPDDICVTRSEPPTAVATYSMIRKLDRPFNLTPLARQALSLGSGSGRFAWVIANSVINFANRH